MASQDCCNFEGIFETLLGAIFRIDCVLGFYSHLVQAENAKNEVARPGAKLYILYYRSIHSAKSAGEE